MNASEKRWNRAPDGGSFRQDEFEHVVVGDLDPTLVSDTVDRPGICRFEWVEETSRTLSLFWCCTRKTGHQGLHIAGTGELVAAVHAPLQANGGHYRLLA